MAFNHIYIQCIGEEMINGLLCEKWRLVQEIGEKTNKYTLWIRYKVRIKSFVYTIK